MLQGHVTNLTEVKRAPERNEDKDRIYSGTFKSLSGYTRGITCFRDTSQNLTEVERAQERGDDED